MDEIRAKSRKLPDSTITPIIMTGLAPYRSMKYPMTGVINPADTADRAAAFDKLSRPQFISAAIYFKNTGSVKKPIPAQTKSALNEANTIHHP